MTDFSSGGGGGIVICYEYLIILFATISINTTLCCILPVSMYLEEVAKGPVSQHLKEGVVISILTNIVQVIMFAPSTDTLLRVDNSSQFSKITAWVNCALEDWLEL